MSYWAVLLLAVAITGVDLLLEPGRSAGALFAVLPLLMAVNHGRRDIIVAGAVGLVLVVLLSWHNHNLTDLDAIARIVAVAATTALALLAHRRRVMNETRLRRLGRVADAAQRALLPPPAPRIGPLQVAASYDAAAEEAQIGGDFYTVVETRWGVRGVIGDVRGHGLGVVRTTAMVVGVFREAAHEEPELSGIVGRMGRSLERDTGLEGFATVLMFSLDDEGVCSMLSFGHPPPLLRHPGGTVRQKDLTVVSPPLGLGLADAADTPGPTRFRLVAGDELLLVTDGVIEARNAAGAFFELAEHFTAAPHAGRPAETVAALRRDLTGWAEDLGDDSALLLLRYQPDDNGSPSDGA